MTTVNILKITPEEEAEIKKTLSRSDADIAEDLKYLKEWFRKQPHLPQEQDDRILTAMLQRNKFSLEKTKNKIDMFYSLRNVVPEFLTDREPLNPQMQAILTNFILTPLPQLTDELDRVYFFRMLNTDLDAFDIFGFTKLLVNSLEIRFLHDKAITDRYVFDYANYTMAHVVKVTPIYIKKLYDVFEAAYTDRIKGIHFLNVPPVATAIITLLKSILKEKIARRIFVHENLESLHKVIPKRILPSDLGGPEKSSGEIHADWRKFLEANNSWFLEEQAKKSNEKLRIGKSLDSYMFGSEGSFRQLAVD